MLNKDLPEKLISLIAILLMASGCSVLKNTPSIPAPEMVFVEGGSFRMGDVVEQQNDDALPIHNVFVEDFYIGKFEVTFDQFDEFASFTQRELPAGDKRGKRAVVHVDWNDARAYCDYFGYRLPSEMEWEYAARSGGQEMLYSGTNSTDSLKYYAIMETSSSFFVGSKKENALGIFDMSGNVYEWIGDYYQFYNQPEKWHDLENSSVRIIRGGSFSGKTHHAAKVFWRVGVLNDTKDYDIGFRCAVSAKKYKP